MDKEALFKPRLTEREVPVEGGTVRVRALSREEVLSMRELQDLEPGAAERAILAKAMVDPELTEEEVGQWQKASSVNEITQVMEVIHEISGLDKVAEKEAYKSVRE